jgi:hypothetical protein
MGNSQGGGHRVPTALEAAWFEELYGKMTTPFAGTANAEVDLLKLIWGSFHDPGEYVPAGVGWKRPIGFQREDPVSDIRGGGLLAVEQLAYFLQKYPTVAVPMAHQQVARREKRLQDGYPFGAVSVNVTRMLLSVLGVIKPSGIRAPFATTQAGYWSLVTSFTSTNELFCLAFELVDKNYHEHGGTYLNFPDILARSKDELTAALNQHRHMSELRADLLGERIHSAYYHGEWAALAWECSGCQCHNDLSRAACRKCMGSVVQRTNAQVSGGGQHQHQHQHHHQQQQQQQQHEETVLTNCLPDNKY